MIDPRVDVNAGLRVGTLASEAAAEFHITAIPQEGRDAREQAESAFTAIAHYLESVDARVLSERIFASPGTFDAIDAVRSPALGGLDDGVPPTRLVVPSSGAPALCGVQIHAVRTPTPPEVLTPSGQGRLVSLGELSWAFLNGLDGGTRGTPRERAGRMFDTAAELLAAANCGFDAVARTWLWLGDICSWYEDLNAARTAFFERCGLLDGTDTEGRLPASTGIGVCPAGVGALCAMDLIAVTGAQDAILRHGADGEQPPAFGYGSAFSRAATVRTPGGRTLFVSGTAAIDDAGRTEHPDAVEPQIEATLEHVRALLRTHGCDPSSLLSTIAYCKDDAVRRAFLQTQAGQTWPGLAVLGEVCRPELTFEIEVTAKL